MTELCVTNLSVVRDGASLVSNASFQLQPGELIVALGPNGAGKTSLLRAALGLERRSNGMATIDGHDTSRLSPMARAESIAYLPQIRPIAWPNLVRDVVALGRFSHGAALGRLQATDRDAVEKALAACDLEHLADRRTDTLSGGEIARVHCARAFAAGAPLLVADEPVAALDPRHQFRIMELIADYIAGGGGALVVLHDISLAARYASRILWMKEGRIVADGSPADTLTAGRLESVYGVRARVSGLSVEIDGAA
jgi:iron complex transport system ATP-binding protein